MLNCVLLFLDMSGGELIVIALVALLVLGPQKMGDFARKAGKMMNEVKRVSSDFTNQLNQETGSLQDEVRSVRDTLKDAANNIKDEFNKQGQEINKNLDTNASAQQNINEPSNDIYTLMQESSDTESQPESTIDEIPAEHSGTQHVSTEQQVDKDSTPKQENNANS